MTRTVLVTGGGRGIGRAIALEFAEPGATIAIAARTVEELERTAGELTARGARAVPLEVDVADEESVDAAFRSVTADVGSLDVVVNNAGVGGGEAIEQSDTRRWRRTIDVNVVGTYLVTRRAVPLMTDGGRIVNMSSVLGRFGVPGYTAYCAAKHAVIGFTRALALELAPRGITVNAICPGWVETDMARLGMTLGAAAQAITYDEFRAQAMSKVPIGRMIQPSEVARLVAFLAAPESSAITGQTYNICGGQTMD